MAEYEVAQAPITPIAANIFEAFSQLISILYSSYAIFFITNDIIFPLNMQNPNCNRPNKKRSGGPVIKHISVPASLLLPRSARQAFIRRSHFGRSEAIVWEAAF